MQSSKVVFFSHRFWGLDSGPLVYVACMLFANRAPPQLILSHRCGRTCFFRTRIFCFLLPQSGFLLFPSSSSFPLLRSHPFHQSSFVSVSFSNRSMQRWEGEVQERESGCGGAGMGWDGLACFSSAWRSVHFKSFRRVSCSQLTSPRARGHSAGTGRCFSYVPAPMDGSHCLFFSVKKDSENSGVFLTVGLIIRFEFSFGCYLGAASGTS